MRLRWFPDNSVALNFVLIILPASAASASAQQLCLTRTASVPVCFSHNDYRLQQTPQISNEMVKEFITLEREYVQNCEKIFSGGDRKKK